MEITVIHPESFPTMFRTSYDVQWTSSVNIVHTMFKYNVQKIPYNVQNNVQKIDLNRGGSVSWSLSGVNLMHFDHTDSAWAALSYFCENILRSDSIAVLVFDRLNLVIEKNLDYLLRSIPRKLKDIGTPNSQTRTFWSTRTTDLNHWECLQGASGKIEKWPMEMIWRSKLSQNDRNASE